MNCYHILGVRPDADSEEIKRAYRNLAKQYHPDRNPGNDAAENLFKQIAIAYDILSDEEQRRAHDFMLKYGNYFNSPPAPPSANTTRTQASAPENRNRTTKRKGPSKKRLAEEKRRFNNSLKVAGLFLVFIFSMTAYQWTEHNKKEEINRLAMQKLTEPVHKLIKDGEYLLAIQWINDFENQSGITLYDELYLCLEAGYRQMKSDFDGGRYEGVLQKLSILQHKHAYLPADSLFYYEYESKIALMDSMSDSTKAFFAIETIESYNRMGYICLYGKKNIAKAKLFFEKAVDLTERDYVDIFGTAYMAVINPNKIPRSHLDTYLGIAECCAQLGDNKSELGYLEWADVISSEKGVRIKQKILNALCKTGDKARIEQMLNEIHNSQLIVNCL